MVIRVKSNGTPEGDSLVDLFNKISTRREDEEKEWIKQLRADGIKGAHPDDGWVDREQNFVQFIYPQFNDGIRVGDRIALGWSWNKDYRIVRVTGIKNMPYVLSKVKGYWFEEIQ